MQTGYVAVPDCLSTFGLLGAESSLSTVHLGFPLPVLVAVQPGGGEPVGKLSKLTVWANAVKASTTPTANAIIVVIGTSNQKRRRTESCILRGGLAATGLPKNG